MHRLISAVIWLLCLCAGAANVGAQQMITDPLLPENAAKQVSAHVYVIMGFPNIGIVVGDKATLVTDTGLGSRNGAVVARTALGLSTRQQRLYLTTTHYHPEHAAGVGGFPAGTIVMRPEVQQAELEADGARMVAFFAARAPQMSELLKGAELGTADMVYDRELDLDLGGVHARLLYFGAAHTKGDELIFVPEDSVLLPGDVVQNKLAPNITCASCSPRQWIAVLDQVAPLAPRVIVPDHGALGGRELIAQERAFLVAVQSRAAALKAQGKSAAAAGQLIAAELAQRYGDWQGLRSVPQAVQRAYDDHP